MNDIVHQLRQASLSKEDYRWQAADLIQSLREKTQYWPDNAERDAVIRHQKEEIERLRARLEIDPSHPYDGIYARDETIRQLDKQTERLRAWNAEIALNAREFAEALREIAKYEIEEGCPCNACQHSAIARAALEGSDG